MRAMNSQESNCTALDNAVSHFLSQRATLPATEKQRFRHWVALLVNQQNQGHNCIRLDDEGRALVLASGLAVEVAGREAIKPMPLVVEADRLYLHRYWRYEQRLASKIKAMQTCRPAFAGVEQVLARYFGDNPEAVDWQCEAARRAVAHAFCIITGGPGTGKTTTVVKILAILLELSGPGLHIALAAPTGKAAMRLQETIVSRKHELPCGGAVKDLIPETVTTLHRLLGSRPPSPYFHHDTQNPLSHDVVVVDEASMIDLALMSKLVDALKPQAKLILLGDKDQLASVESGAVLADLCAALPRQTVELKTSHRFGGSIKELAVLIRQGQAEKAWQLLQPGDAACQLLASDPADYIAQQQKPYLSLIDQKAGFQEIFAAHSRFQTLCANRQGRNGVVDINLRVEQLLHRQQLIRPASTWYSGRPVLVVQNAPALQVYNGDIGLCLPDHGQDGKLMVFFRRADGAIKKFPPNRLPECETVYAMTIHKSQGSEFEAVLVVLPETGNAVLSRELVYTAVTRAKKSVKLVSNPAVFTQALKQTEDRATGLVAKLQEGLGHTLAHTPYQEA